MYRVGSEVTACAGVGGHLLVRACGAAPAGQSAFGYQCYHIDAEALKLTPKDAWDGKGFHRCSKVRRRTAANWASRRAWSTSPGRYRSKMGSFRS